MFPTPPPSYRRLRLLAGSLLLTVGLAGCVAAPLPKLDHRLPAHWRHAAAQAAARPPLDLHGWWKAFGDPQLNRLVDQALAANLDVAQAQQRLLAERALYGARQAPNRPHLRVRTDDPIDPDASASYFVIGFDATWELGLFGRGTANQRVAAGDLREADATLRAARVSLVAEVVRDWIELRAAQQRERLREQIVQAQRHHQRLLATRVHLKLAAPAALAQARAAVAEARADLAAPRADADAAAQRLALLLGRSEPEPAWLHPGRLPQLGATGPLGAPAELLRSRPGIALAEARVLQAAGELNLAHSDLFPHIGLGASVLWSTNIATYRRRGGTNQIGTVGPLIDIPLFDWGMRLAREHAQAHRLKAAVLAYRKAVLEGVADVETALGNLQQQRQRETALDAAVAAWKQAAAAQATQQRLGLSSALDGSALRVQRSHSALQLIDARSQRDIAYVALFKALGGAPPPPAADDRPPARGAAR